MLFLSINDVYLPRIVCRFLLVSLSIDAILGKVTIRQRRKKLEQTTQGDGLSDAYTATLTRLKAQKGYKSVLGLKALMWVLYSERPLQPEELRHALGVEIGFSDLIPGNVPALRTILASCLGLVTVEASSSIVQLVHPTLREYLLTDPTLFDRPHSIIAEVCLTHLNFRNVWDLEPTLGSAPPTMPLLEYASCYWGDHTRKGMTEDVKALALKLLSRFDGHISARLMLLHYNDDRRSGPSPYEVGATGFTGLHAVAFLGISAIAAPVLKMKDWDVNASDCTGGTALTWAAKNGHEGVVRVLLEREDFNPDQADTDYDRTPLSWAAGMGYGGVVNVLLGRKDVDPNRVDSSGRTPLSWAAGSGHERVVKVFLEREDIISSLADSSGRTPLLWAVARRDKQVVKLFLECGCFVPNQAPTDQVPPVSLKIAIGDCFIITTLFFLFPLLIIA